LKNNPKDNINVYTPHRLSKNPFILLMAMASDILKSHSLGLRLAKRNIKALYRQSLLGYFWSLIPPLVTSFVWILLNSQKVVSIEISDVPYPLFVIVGTILWQVFAESVIAPLKSVGQGKSILTKINFPRESLILSGIYEVLFESSTISIQMKLPVVVSSSRSIPVTIVCIRL